MMGEAFITRRGGGGGGGLNFRVIGGTTAPSSPKENDIWVNTEAKVTGYIFASEVQNLHETELTCTKESTGQYLDANGTVASNSSFALSNYVELPENTRYITVYHGTAGSSTMYHAFYDTDQNFISSVFRENKTLTYAVPANAAYVRLSLCTMSTADSLTFTASVDDCSIAEGTVWIAVGTSSVAEFNALKKNELRVDPMSAKQYVDGAWVTKTAKSYQNGEWVDWMMYLYNKGAEYVDENGNGWKFSGTYTKNADNIRVGATGGSAYSGYAESAYVDMSSFSTVELHIIEYQQSGTECYSNIKIIDESGATVIEQEIKKGSGSGSDITVSVDVSAVTSKCKVRITAGHTRTGSGRAARVDFDIVRCC